MRGAIVGAGLAGLAAAVDLVDAGHTVDLYEARPFIGGKVGSWEDPDGNHVEMGLHVFFFNYANLFALMKKVGAIDHLLPKEHTHLFVNHGGDVRSLDFRFALGAPFNGLKAFFTTSQLDWIDNWLPHGLSKEGHEQVLNQVICSRAMAVTTSSVGLHH